MRGYHYSWSAIQRFGTQIISFVGNVLIARLLTPDDYGLIAMLAIFMSIAMNFTESGFADYLIRDPKSSSKEFSVVFVHNVVFAVLFYAILYIIAPWIARFYEEPELVVITRVLGLNIIIKALSLSEFTRMRKALEFKNMAIIQIVGALVGLIVGYLMALYNYGYWALVGQVLTMGVVTLIMLTVVNAWWPKWYFDWKMYKVMRKFGNNMLVSYFTNQIGANLYAVFIGKFHSASALGFYNQAEKINKISFQSINGIVLTTSYSLLAKEQNRVKRLKMYKNLLNHFLFVHLAISAFIIGAAKPIMSFVFGVQWLPTAPLLQLVLISFLLQPLVTINSNIVKIENKPHIYRNLTFLRNGLLLLMLLITYTFSIEIILMGQIIARMISAIVDVFVCGKYIEFYPVKQLVILTKQILAPGVALVFGFLMLRQLETQLDIVKLMGYALVYIIVFVGVNLVVKNETMVLLIKKIQKSKQ
ncbi:lipopolysaccharide biosynthesis protein [Mangrovimonas cancribranchiae]|uniref:Lipopolysaccharide biosynthesis protein n=1 Tax=Mangrovimonas cancribranchiae TaxID=3080055 RepID=A0AAU6P2U8_9FLAO